MEIPFEGRVERDVMVPMRDGVHLAVDVYGPAPQAGPLPALLAMSPYGKNVQRQILPAPVEARVTDLCAEAGWTPDLVDRGYVHVIADTRGSGRSEGAFYGMYSEQESRDGYDLVEWIAAQPWCDGNVGMIGISYFGTVQLVVAASRPPHLKAIAPLEATTDPYLACYHGGVLDAFYTELPHGGMTDNTGSGMDLADARSWTIAHLGAEHAARLVADLVREADLVQYNVLRSIAENPRRNTIFFDILLNPYADSPYWWRPDLSAIDIPVLCGCAWYPDCGPKFVRGPHQIWQGVRGPKKMIMAPPGWLERPFWQYHAQVLDWFDHWLKGIDNGVQDEAPVQLWVSGADVVRREETWPPPGVRWTDLYLGTHRRLVPEPVRYEGVEPDGYVQQPPLVARDIGSLTWSTPPQPRDLEVVGPVALHLYASLDATDGWFKATLLDVAPDGATTEISHGHLRCSHRELDAAASTDALPVHPHTRAAARDVPPGEICAYAIEIYPVAHVFAKGHRLAVRICSGDLPGEGFSFHMMRGTTTCYRIHHDRSHPSRLVIPLVPRSERPETRHDHSVLFV